MGEVTQKHVKAVAQQEHGASGSSRRRNRRGENTRVSGTFVQQGSI
jgi:hypothetical protein